jgi:hypothetical protein
MDGKEEEGERENLQDAAPLTNEGLLWGCEFGCGFRSRSFEQVAQHEETCKIKRRCRISRERAACSICALGIDFMPARPAGKESEVNILWKNQHARTGCTQCGGCRGRARRLGA